MDTYGHTNGAIAGKRMFDPKIKADAVARSYEVTLTQAAKEFGLPISTLSSWRTKAKGRYRKFAKKPFTANKNTEFAKPTFRTDNNIATAKTLIETALTLLKNY